MLRSPTSTWELVSKIATCRRKLRSQALSIPLLPLAVALERDPSINSLCNYRIVQAMGDTEREAAATLASLLNASTDDDGNSKSADISSPSPKNKQKNNTKKKRHVDETGDSEGAQAKTSNINWHAILSTKEVGDDWEYHYSILQIYKQRHQHVDVPRDGTHDDLHDWIKMQKAKSAYLQPEQVSALQTIGVLPTKLSHDIAYSNPPRPPRSKRRKVEPVVKQKEKPKFNNKKKVSDPPPPNPYSNADNSAREKSKVSRAERAKRRKLIEPVVKQKEKAKVNKKMAADPPPNPYSNVDNIAREKSKVEQKEKPKVNEKKVAVPNPYSNVDNSARDKSKVSRAERAKKRLGQFKTAFINSR